MNSQKFLKVIFISILALLTMLSGKTVGVLASPAEQSLGTTNQISQFGITWTFDQPYEYGQFANGDYWVVGPVTIVNINPPSTNIGGRVINGSMVNPSPLDGNVQGYDSSMSANTYDPNMNVARPNGQNLSAGNPLVLQPGSSLVSSISVSEAGHRPQLQTAAVLTVLDSVPPAGSFRPPYAGSDKTINFNISQINWSLLKQLPPVSETPDMATVERYFERPWLDHIPTWMGREQHPVDNMPNYGREMSTQVGIAALMLHLDYTNAEKETLLRRYLQLGIDWHGVIQAGGTDLWEPNGGHASGRKWPIMLAGLMLGDTHMADIGPGDGTGTAHFGEDGQTFYVSQADIDFPRDLSIQDIRGCPGVDSQAPDPNDLPPEMQLPTGYAYQQNNLRLPEWGVRHSTRPQYDNKLWCSGYRQCCTGNAWSGFVLAAHIMGAKDTWDHDPLFDYMDRYMAVETPGTWTRCFDDFSEEMWDTYRADYSVLWPGVRLSSTPLNLTTVRLAWDFEGTVPATTTWQIDYYTQTTTAPLSVTNIISPTRNYNLTGLTSHTWYTVTLYAMLNNIPFISETIRAIATDRIVYLPVVLK